MFLPLLTTRVYRSFFSTSIDHMDDPHIVSRRSSMFVEAEADPVILRKFARTGPGLRGEENLSREENYVRRKLFAYNGLIAF